MSELPNDVRAKILIAEDDAIVALDLQGMVMRLGYDVVAIVDSGQAAIAAAKRFQPDIILLDMILTGAMDGIDVAREIHKSNDLPIVFCVSSPDLSSLVRAKEISYSGYLLKPINPDSLATTLDTVLYKYKLEKRVQQAEARFRALAEKCELIQFFFDREASFEWTWSAGDGFRSTVADGNVFKILQSAVGPWLSGDSDRIALTLAVPGPDGAECHYAALGIKKRDPDVAQGVLIPLECPRK